MIIFDLDGTLADCEHRRHFVQPHEKKWVHEADYYGEKFNGQFGNVLLKKDGSLFDKPDWKSFYEACDKDEPIYPTLEIFKLLGENNEIQIWSGRCESVREKTIQWFLDNWFIGSFEDSTKMWLNDILKMRPIDDYTPDDQLKEKWLDEALSEGKKIDFVFDDRPKVIRMWKSRGIFVFNCCQHDGEF